MELRAVSCGLHLVLGRPIGIADVYWRSEIKTMTRVVVQRGGGGVSNQTQSRAPPSHSASVPPSSTTPLSNSQLPLGNDISDVSETEADDFKGEPHPSLAASGSGKCVPHAVTSDPREIINEIESVVGQNEENLARQLQHALVVGKELDTTPELYPSGSDSSCGVTTVNIDGEGQSNSFERSAEELSGSSESSSRPQSGRAQSSSSSGQKVPSCNLTSHPLPSSIALTAPISKSSSGVQPVSHSPPLSPPSVHPLLVVSSDALPVSRTTHEENDLGRYSSTFTSSDPVGCSPAPTPIPLAPPPPSMPASSRRSGWVGCSALNANRGPTSRRKSIALKGTRSSPNSSRPTSPRSYGEGDGYNSADEQSPWTPGPSGYKDGVSYST